MKIKTWLVCLLLLTLWFFLLVSPYSCEGGEELEAAPEAKSIPPVEEDRIVDVTPVSLPPASSTATTEATSAPPTTADPDTSEDTTAETDTQAPELFVTRDETASTAAGFSESPSSESTPLEGSPQASKPGGKNEDKSKERAESKDSSTSDTERANVSKESSAEHSEGIDEISSRKSSADEVNEVVASSSESYSSSASTSAALVVTLDPASYGSALREASSEGTSESVSESVATSSVASSSSPVESSSSSNSLPSDHSTAEPSPQSSSESQSSESPAPSPSESSSSSSPESSSIGVLSSSMSPESSSLESLASSSSSPESLSTDSSSPTPSASQSSSADSSSTGTSGSELPSPSPVESSSSEPLSPSQPLNETADRQLPTTPESSAPIETNCSATDFGCCQDNVTVATGANFTGCNAENETLVCNGDECCKSSAFGCCPDMKTPAKGKGGEGCTCDHSQFGCCEDKIRSATGPNFEGCDCTKMPNGCCPDGKTPATGPKNGGCGCQASAHGCCPDNKTPARGSNQTGCSCEAQLNGCCPDHLTPATGPKNEGCPCSTMPFGCCPNSTQAATGPLFASCNCAETPYGCCPNGKSVAIGPKFEGCPNGTPLDMRLSAQACSLLPETGGCRNYTIKWTYNITYGACTRFWYGGCEGNANRFHSEEQCDRVCVAPEGSEACLLPKVKGPCAGAYPSFFFNSEAGVCEEFTYGGCLGNKNRFDTLEACQQLCLSIPSQDPCEQPVIQGPCRGYNPRWYYSKQDGRCRSFVYGGCKQNGNNFESEAACRAKCGSATPQQLCILPKAEGPCLGQYPRWYYDYLEQSCKEFTYTGCEGNRNRFVDKFSCERTCNETKVVVPTDVCSLPKEEGPCRRQILRWYFNTNSNRCEQFYYGGCQGNANKFESRVDCERACVPVTEEQNVCLLSLDAGVLEENCIKPFYNFPDRWFYNQSDQVCHRFYYTGCGGNGNNFHALEECQQRCGRPVAPSASAMTIRKVDEFNSADCALPADRGPCANNEFYWWYDHRDGVCKEFYWGGCGGNNNRFGSRKECEMKCWNSQDICKLKHVRGPCLKFFVQWFYDPAYDQCLSFNYSGCSGNANRFSQKEACEAQCKIEHQAKPAEIPYPDPTDGDVMNGVGHRSPDVEAGPPAQAKDPVCLLPVAAGKCHSYHHQYYYDANENMCRIFVYTGCEGNSNRFDTRPQCEDRCVSSLGEDEILIPVDKDVVCRLSADSGACEETHARWFYDPASFNCMPFVYTGCAGNKNRFKSFETCLKFCQGVPPLNPIGSTDVHPPDEPETERNKPTGQPSGSHPYPVFTPPTTTTTVATTTQRDICKFECSDSQSFDGCPLIVMNQFCSNPIYAKVCCKTCYMNKLLDMDTVKDIIIGPNNAKYHPIKEGNRLCFYENNA